MHKCTCPYYLWSFSFMFLHTNTHRHTYLSPHLVKPRNILTFHLKKKKKPRNDRSCELCVWSYSNISNVLVQSKVQSVYCFPPNPRHLSMALVHVMFRSKHTECSILLFKPNNETLLCPFPQVPQCNRPSIMNKCRGLMWCWTAGYDTHRGELANLLFLV